MRKHEAKHAEAFKLEVKRLNSKGPAYGKMLSRNKTKRLGGLT